MKTTGKQVAQWVLLCLLWMVGSVAFIFVIGEDNPESPMSFAQFLLIKGAAFVVLFVLIYAGRMLTKRGWLPDIEKYFGNGNYARAN